MDKMPCAAWEIEIKERDRVARRIELLEQVADLARNYHELFEPGMGRTTVSSRLAQLIHKLDATLPELSA